VIGVKAGAFRIGCAGWTIPRQHASSFPKTGSHLERYAARLNAVEIDSSFYRAHRRATYERWVATAPGHFAFAVKAPKEITHRLRLVDTAAALEEFLVEVGGLKEKLGPLLFQLPPSLTFDAKTVESFLALLRERFAGSVVCEPRSSDWFTTRANDLLKAFRIGRAAVDPAVANAAAQPGGWSGVTYFRLHGSPRMYYSEYGAEQLDRFADQLARAGADCHPVWCIFDNTAAGAATANALALQKSVERRRSPP
jgi:uncharacterized protein YecE (DUF72 family)